MSVLPAGWPTAMPRVLREINRIDARGLESAEARYPAGHPRRPPAWAADPELWPPALTAAVPTPPAIRRAPIHRDLHPGNLVWCGGDVVAVIDRLSGCVGPVAVAGAHLRVDPALDVESAAADAFRDEYLATAPPDVWYPAGDIIEGMDSLPYYPGKEAVDRRSWDDRPRR